MNKLSTSEDIKAYIEKLYYTNCFTYNCGIRIIKVECGKVHLGLTVEEGRHTNLVDTMHGGMLMTLMDNSTGIVGATVGKKVITVSMNNTFIKTAPVGHFVESVAVIDKVEGKLMNVHTEVHDIDTGDLLCKSMSVMFTVGEYSEIAENW